MREKRPWSKLLLFLPGFLVLLAIWDKILLSQSTTFTPPMNQAAYTLLTHTNDAEFIGQTRLLPENDYNKLIDLDFNFSRISFTCNESVPVLLLVLVHSSPNNYAKRQTIRETWGQKDEDVKILFMIGSVDSVTLQETLEAENKIHKDFIQGSFYDTYKNLTYKHVMSLKYFVYHCPQAKYILKTDDDVFVNMPTMKNFLTYDLSPFGTSKGLFCDPRYNSLVLRSYRSKWRVSFREYPAKFYPTYCPGWTLLYSPDVALALYKEAQKADYFWIDDIHITGTLTQKLNFTHTNIKPLILTKNYLYLIINWSYNLTQPFLYGAELKELEIRSLWNLVSKREAPKFIFKNINF